MNLLKLVFVVLCFGIAKGNPLVKLKKENGATVLQLFMKTEAYDHSNHTVPIRMCIGEGEMEIQCHFAPGIVLDYSVRETITRLEHNGISIASLRSTNVQGPIITTRNRYYSQNMGKMSFQCIAYSMYEHASVDDDIPGDVLYSPLVMLTNFDCGSNSVEDQKIKALIGGQIELLCWNEPLSPNITVEWYLEGLWSGHQSLIETTEKLTLTNISHQHVGLYKCHVWFEDLHFRYSKHSDLRLLAPPLPPSRLHLIAPSERSVIFEWQPDPFDRLELAPEALQYSYKIKYNKMSRWVVDGPMQINTSDASAALLNLSRDTWYRVEIIAFNSYGESDPIRYDFATTSPVDTQAGIIADTRITVAANQKVMLSCRRYGNASGVKWHRYDLWRWSEQTNSHQLLIDTSRNLGGLYKYQAQFPNGSTHEFIIRVSVVAQPKPLNNLKCTAKEGNLALSWLLPWNATEEDRAYSPTSPPPTPASTTPVQDYGQSLYEIESVEEDQAYHSPTLPPKLLPPPPQDHAQYYLIQFTKLRSRRNEWKERKVGTDAMKMVLQGLESGVYAVRITAMNEAGASMPRSTTCRM